jgi:hypothetical protein
MKAKKLYVCGTAWDWERDTTNGGQLEFYNTVKALKAERKCWKECGIIEVTPGESHYIVKPIPTKKWERISGEELQRQQDIYIPLANKLIKLAMTAGDNDLAQSALTWALGEVKRNGKKKKAIRRS